MNGNEQQYRFVVRFRQVPEKGMNQIQNIQVYLEVHNPAANEAAANGANYVRV